MSHLYTKTVLVAVLSSFLFGCQLRAPASSDLSRLRDADTKNDSSFSITGLRYQALRDAALSIGARGGLAWRAKQIRKSVYAHEKKLDFVFNFRGLILDDNVIPPVMIEGRNSFEIPSDDIVRIADRSYVIIQQARFASNPPNWRDYLKMEYADPELPDRSLLPKNSSEKQVWERYIEEGWRAGIIQANTIFLENIGRLKRDFEGMVRYHTLLAQGMVTIPYVARVELGITGDSETMSVNDRVLRITAKPGFEHNSRIWHPETIASADCDEEEEE